MTITMPTPLVKSVAAATKLFPPKTVGDAIIEKFYRMRSLRDPVEVVWDECYELYRASESDLKSAKKRSHRTAGDHTEWHHMVNTGQAFDVVETLVAYFKGATFPSDDWFDMKGEVPELYYTARVVKELTKAKLEQARIRERVEQWLRNYCIFGISTYRVGWVEELQRVFSVGGGAVNREVGRLDIEPLSPYDVWVDTGDTLERGGTYVRLRLTKAELQARVDSGYYTLDQTSVDRYEDYHFGDPNQVGMMAGSDSRYPNELVEYYGSMLVGGVEFWCCHAVFFGRQLVRLADSAYWCGSPFVTATMLPNRDSIYGMSVLHPNLGGLHILNVLTNTRLDNMLMQIMGMYTMVEDGILSRDDVKARPGAVFKVAQHGSLQRMEMGRQDFVVTYQEAQVQEQNVYRNTSTGPLIGNAQPRSGERVTAAEIQGVRDAGGNRLSSQHTHIEDAVTLPLLEKVFMLMQQHYVTPEMVRMFEPELDQDAFYEVPPEYLKFPFKFTALGANYVVERERALQDLLQLLDISGRVPPIAERINYEAIMEDLLRQMRFNNPKRYLKAPPQQAAPSEAAPPNLAESVGGQPLEEAMAQELQLGGGEDTINAMGIDTSDIPPEQLQAMLQQMGSAMQPTITTTEQQPL